MSMAQPDPAGMVVDAAVLAANGATLDLLARRQLAARRMGGHILLHDPSPALRRLIAFAGLEQVLRLEPRGQAEQREEPLGVEEERQLLDPPV
jgi:anti-anti-sigma regulatory factor